MRRSQSTKEPEWKRAYPASISCARTRRIEFDWRRKPALPHIDRFSSKWPTGGSRSPSTPKRRKGLSVQAKGGLQKAHDEMVVVYPLEFHRRTIGGSNPNASLVQITSGFRLTSSAAYTSRKSGTRAEKVCSSEGSRRTFPLIETSRLSRCGRGAPSYSITSSARASSIGGTSRPSVLAVLRLMTSSYLVGACTGRSPGFSPLRMRSTYDAARR